MSDRRGLFKNADRDAEKMRRYRNDNSVEIRKVKKDDNLQKRRNIQLDDLSDTSPVKENVKPTYSLSVRDVCKILKSENMAEKLEAIITCRKQLSKPKSPPIEQYFIGGVIPVLVNIMKSDISDTMTFESAWALTNIASGESRHTNAVVDAGAVPVFISLMSSGSDEIVEQCIWALANIVGDSDKNRNVVVKQGIKEIIIKTLRRFWGNTSIVRQVAWLFSNVCRHKSDVYPTKDVVGMLPIIYELLSTNSDIQMQSDITWGLSYATDSQSDVVDALIQYKMIPLFNANLSRTENIVAPSIRLLGNIVAGTDEQANAAISAGVIQAIAPLLNGSGSSKIVKECCWLLSNISAGTEEQVTALINSGIILSVLEVMINGDYKSQKEAVWVISNMICSGKDEPKLYLLNNNVFTAMVKLLSCDDNKVVIQLMESIRALLEVSEQYNELDQCIQVFEAAGGIDVIEELQNHTSDDVYNMSYELVKQFFSGDDDEDNEAGNANIQQFEF